MDYKKLNQIKTPEEWLNPLMDLEKDNTEINFPSVKRKIYAKHRTAAAVFLCILALGTGITVAASTSDVFRSFLEQLFGKQEVTEVHLNTDTQIKEDAPDIKIDAKNMLTLQENTQIVGEQESFISEYHFEKENEIVDRVYRVQKDGLKQLSFSKFQGNYDENTFSFEYVITNQEIYAFNYTGDLDEVFHYVDGNTIYAALYHVNKKDIIQKACIAALNLKTGEVTKLSDDTMICNFVMSPNGKVILCNHRADGYWSVFDIDTKTEKIVKPIDGYTRTSEIEFLDDYHIITLGQPFMKGNVEWYSSYLINLRTQKVEKEYKDNGEITMQWSYTWENQSLKIYNITNTQEFSIQNVSDAVQPIGVRGNYALFGNLEEEEAAFYLVNLEKQTFMELDIPKEMQSDLEIHLVKNEKKILITNALKAYLVDISQL